MKPAAPTKPAKPLELIEQGRFLGEEFILWLWMRGLEDGGASGQEGDLSSCFVDDAVMLQSEQGEVKEISLRKGNPAESREAFEAISRGMRPSRAKLRILSGDMEWVFTLQAAGLDLSGLKLPPTASKDPVGRITDRLFLLEEGAGHLERRFNRFLHHRAADPGSMLGTMKTWIRSGLSGAAFTDQAEVPWES